MDFDFAAILVTLSALTGIIWAVDALFFAKSRAQRAAETPTLVNAVKEPIIVEYARSFFPVIFIVLIVRSFLAEPFRIPSSSMMPTLVDGDFILVSKFAYGLRLPVLDYKFLDIGEPQRGDPVVFRYPGNPRLGDRDPHIGQDYIKRVIGLPGDEVIYRNKQIFINGQLVEQTPVGRYVGEGSSADATGFQHLSEQLPGRTHDVLINPLAISGRGDGRWVVPEGHYFVMGDNRDNSEDSRFWGFVPEKNLVGKAFLIWMNFDSKAGGVNFSRLGTVIE
ncbi:MAG: signal peptidase I [Lysobacteraceae bacterium]